jgi:hypothetical protein
MRSRRPILWAIVTAVVLAAGAVAIAGQHGVSRNPTGKVPESVGAAFDPIRSDEIQSILPQDAIPALIKPAYLSASKASDIYDQEEVIGVVINGDARAYPLSTLSAHEIVDDDIGGQPVAVTW